MDPLTLSVLAGVGATAASQLPALVPNQYDRSQKKRMQELQRMQELGLLGLTDQERSQLQARGSSMIRMSEDAAANKRAQYLAGGGGATGGQSLLQAQLADEQKLAAQERLNTEIESQDIAAKQRQIEELNALEAGRALRQKERVAAAGAIIGSGIEAGVTTAAQEKLFAGARNPSTNTVAALSKTMGVSPDEARGFIELAATNPQMLAYLEMINKNGK